MCFTCFTDDSHLWYHVLVHTLPWLMTQTSRVQRKMKFVTVVCPMLLASLLWLLTEAARTEGLPSSTRQICSLNYPKDYPNDIRWSLVIHARDPDSALHITFTHFDLEGSARCTRDYLDVYDDGLDEDTSRHLGRFCGSTSPGDITTSESSALLILITNANVSRSGFCIMYYSIEKNDMEYKQNIIVICSVYGTMLLLVVVGFLKYKYFDSHNIYIKERIHESSICEIYASDATACPPSSHNSKTVPSCTEPPPPYNVEHI
ncbi:mannan-binding lectin serine protease 1-like [Haliotis rufescens]|uniref:mannan-binding lectin serine protease 1-like n=1 Tax=Haliotis rufescens TaxID=6454 RepID=UPI00201F306A|nr:mannan-binding lectin serine protease 1-like [Haliotis rufescens]